MPTLERCNLHPSCFHHPISDQSHLYFGPFGTCGYGRSQVPIPKLASLPHCLPWYWSACTPYCTLRHLLYTLFFLSLRTRRHTRLDDTLVPTRSLRQSPHLWRGSTRPHCLELHRFEAGTRPPTTITRPFASRFSGPSSSLRPWFLLMVCPCKVLGCC